MEDSVSYAQWTVRAVPSLPQNAYKAIESGSADTCDCANCEHWLRIRDDVLPAEFQEFLRKLGIDASKEHDISEYEGGTIVHGRCLYVGVYYCAGVVLDGPDATTVHETGTEYSTETHEIEPGFKVGISSNVPNSFVPSPFNPRSSIQVTFEIHTPCPDADA